MARASAISPMICGLRREECPAKLDLMPYDPGVVDKSGQIRAEAQVRATKSITDGLNKGVENAEKAQAERKREDAVYQAKADALNKFVRSNAKQLGLESEAEVAQFLSPVRNERPRQRVERLSQQIEMNLIAKNVAAKAASQPKAGSGVKLNFGRSNPNVQKLIGSTPSEAEKVAKYREYAEDGDPAAQFNLGLSYAQGTGTKTNPTEAVKWFRKSAEQGNRDAQNNLGAMYYKGQGVPENYAEAAKWYTKAAEQGSPTAQYNLGYMYGHGKGVIKDLATSHAWFNLSHASGNTLAAEPLKNLEVLMTKEQLSEATVIARDLFKRIRGE